MSTYWSVARRRILLDQALCITGWYPLRLLALTKGVKVKVHADEDVLEGKVGIEDFLLNALAVTSADAVARAEVDMRVGLELSRLDKHGIVSHRLLQLLIPMNDLNALFIFVRHVGHDVFYLEYDTCCR